MDPALWEEVLRAEAGADADREVEAVVRFREPGVEVPGVRVVSRFGTVATCRIPISDIVAVRARPEVLSVKAARGVVPGREPDAAVPDSPGARPLPRRADLRRGPLLGPTGAGVVVAAVDWGADVASAAFQRPPDALDPQSPVTRFLGLWDQREQAAGSRPDPYGYGHVHSRAEIDRALRDPWPYERLGYHPAIADPSGRGSHGTRVLDIAAGNGRAGGPAGVAPDAELLFVHLADRRTGGVGNFGDSVRLLEACDWIFRTAGSHPCVINISAGRICGPKDGTTLVERAFDELLSSRTGTFIVNTAGNYLQWRAHARGTLDAGETHQLTFVVHPTDVTTNEVEIWYDGRDEFAVRLSPPGRTATRWVGLGERADIRVDGRVVGRVYHRANDPNNGDHHIVAYIDPVGCAGDWTIALEGRRVVRGRYHSFIERDDRCPGCQTRFTSHDSDRATTLGAIATSRLPLVVGAYDAHDPARPPAGFSSAGPSRDGRRKPDLVAPGVAVLAARSAPPGTDRNTGLLVRGSGTSFAAPHVTGAVALCLEVAGGRLDARDIRALVLGSCDPPAGADSRFRLGSGYLNIARLVADAEELVAARGAGRAPAAEDDVPAEDSYDDVVLLISENEKPRDVAEYWARQVRAGRTGWGHPLSELERGYIEAFIDPRTPGLLRMRAPVDPARLTADERTRADAWFGAGPPSAARYANYENRRRIVANHVDKHPATLRAELGLHRVVRDVDPLHFALERGWQRGGGWELFTGDHVAQLGAAGEFLLSLGVVYGVGRALGSGRPVPARPAPTVRSRPLTDPVWDLPPQGGGTWIDGRWYSEHALERMAPDMAQVRAELGARTAARLRPLGIGPDHPAYAPVMARALKRIDPRGVPPSVVEAEIARPGSTGVKVVTARRGQVVASVVPRR
ncbi:S8 family serine peptidase [Streptomyces sp. NPDC002306]